MSLCVCLSVCLHVFLCVYLCVCMCVQLSSESNLAHIVFVIHVTHDDLIDMDCKASIVRYSWIHVHAKMHNQTVF